MQQFFRKHVSTCLILSGLFVGQAMGQQHRHPETNPADAPVIPPGAIDGSKTPDKIPDAVAYRLFFLAVSEPFSASTDEVRRQKAKLRVVGLSAAEENAVFEVLAEFHEHYAELVQRFAAAIRGNSSNGASLDPNAFSAERDALTEGTRAALKARLTVQGLASLHEHVQKEKRGMTIVPFPPMP